ncbi:adenylate kinase-domain-containing protein [Globomyces pollinis-pini]|nr:adenylate kinase-domain-containing protein [Globomyces pollinis-pini]
MSINPYLTDGVANEALEYLENYHIKDMMECMVIGMAHQRPIDPILFMEDCLQRVKKDRDYNPRARLQWNAFLPMIKSNGSSLYTTQNQKGIYRRLGNNNDVIPAIVNSNKLMRPINPVIPKMNQYDPLPDISVNEDTLNQQIPSKNSYRNVIFILGGPGSGKGTQCEKLSKEYSYTHLSVGELLRQEGTKDTSLGNEINRMMKKGEIVPMRITLKLLKKAMLNNDDSNGFLIDGFPRKLDQALEFEKMICKPKLIVYYKCGMNILQARILKRGQTSGREDDNLETLQKRFTTFIDISYPVVEHYMKMNKCLTILAEDSIEEVYNSSKLHFAPHPPLYHNNITFVLGGPGSGKGTQCERLAAEFNLVHLSTGDLLREQVSQQTPLGLEAEILMKEGKMVPHGLLLEILRDKIEKNFSANGFLIDGFPRNMEQAHEFERMIGPCRSVLAYQCSFETLERRLLERGKTSGRADDNLDTIKKRFKTFQEQSKPVIDYYKAKGNCTEISSENEIHQVYSDSKQLFVPPTPISHPNIIFMLGGPGSGKGTQCSHIVEDFKLKHISTGELLRKEVNNRTAIGNLIESQLSNGNLVSTNLVIGLLKHEIEQNILADGFLIDGFPRTLSQALEFERIIGKPRGVISLICPPEILESRLIERATIQNRSDDNQSTIKNRIKLFQSESTPLFHYYEKQSLLVKIAAASALPYEIYSVLIASFPFKMKNPFIGKKLIFILGGPGSGKGTQCENIIHSKAYSHTSTGDLLREQVKNKTHIGKSIESLLKEGKMVPDSLILSLLKRKLQSLCEDEKYEGHLIDGFPRTLEQAKMFETEVAPCEFVLYFEVSNQTLTQRLLKRGETSGRSDDNMESIKTRLQTFENESFPVIQYYLEKGRVKTVNAEQNVDSVKSETLQFF